MAIQISQRNVMRFIVAFLAVFLLLTVSTAADYTCQAITCIQTSALFDGECPIPGCVCVNVPPEEYQHSYTLYQFSCSGSVPCEVPCTRVSGPAWQKHWVCDPRFCPNCELTQYSPHNIECDVCLQGQRTWTCLFHSALEEQVSSD